MKALLSANRRPPLTTTVFFPDAYAIVISELFSRQEPFSDVDAADAIRRVAACQEQPPVRPSLPLNIPGDVSALMHECWADDPLARPSFVAIKERMTHMEIHNIGLNLFARRADQAKQARVLHDVFPPHIADMLKRGQKVKPERRDDITIFFSDIVGFTVISSTLSPEKVSEMLDRLYTRFDNLVIKHDLFKVETIGGLVVGREEWDVGRLSWSYLRYPCQQATPTLRPPTW